MESKILDSKGCIITTDSVSAPLINSELLTFNDYESIKAR